MKAKTEWITFTCDKEDCNNERTERKKVYDKSRVHFCSKECLYAHRRKYGRSKPLTDVGLEARRKRRKDFVKKFNEMFLTESE